MNIVDHNEIWNKKIGGPNCDCHQHNNIQENEPPLDIYTYGDENINFIFSEIARIACVCNDVAFQISEINKKLYNKEIELNEKYSEPIDTNRSSIELFKNNISSLDEDLFLIKNFLTKFFNN